MITCALCAQASQATITFSLLGVRAMATSEKQMERPGKDFNKAKCHMCDKLGRRGWQRGFCREHALQEGCSPSSSRSEVESSTEEVPCGEFNPPLELKSNQSEGLLQLISSKKQLWQIDAQRQPKKKKSNWATSNQKKKKNNSSSRQKLYDNLKRVEEKQYDNLKKVAEERELKLEEKKGELGKERILRISAQWRLKKMRRAMLKLADLTY